MNANFDDMMRYILIGMEIDKKTKEIRKLENDKWNCVVDDRELENIKYWDDSFYIPTTMDKVFCITYSSSKYLYGNMEFAILALKNGMNVKSMEYDSECGWIIKDMF